MAEKDSFSFEIKISVGEISKSSKGWTKELNLSGFLERTESKV